MQRFLYVLLTGAVGCSSPAVDPGPGPLPGPDGQETAPLPPAPWSGAALRPAEAPRVLLEEWRAAPNRARCAPIAPASISAGPASAGAGAIPRAATFSGGWAVAYDVPGLRSAFGVAGTGVAAVEPAYTDWPHERAWRDGSTAAYGPEGGTGSNQLAYLRIAGQDCLYNVWSRLGVEHLEFLLGQLRFVAAD